MLKQVTAKIEHNALMYPHMDGKRVYLNAVRGMVMSTQTALAKTGLSWDDIQWFVPHQANLRINEKVVEVAKIPPEKVLNTIEFYGNTTAATVPLTIDHWRQQGKVKRGYLGITLESVHDQFAKVYNLPEARGAIVMSVTQTEGGQQTPAAKIGMQANDVIVEFEGAPVNSAQDLIQRVASTPVGQQVTLVFLRDVNGKLDKRTATVALGERPPSPLHDWVEPSKPTTKSGDPRGNALHLGITLAELTPQLLTERHLTGVQGLFVKDIDPNGLLADIRVQPSGQPALQEGDVINRINRTTVGTLGD